VELEQSRRSFEEHGVNVAVITYDSNEILRRFSDTNHLGYPCLSDKGSVAIEKFGILNTNVPKDHQFYGIPFPTDYVIGADGIIRAKYFLPDYQTRVASSKILLDQFDVAGAKLVSIDADDLRVTIATTAEHSVAGQEIGVAANFSLATGWHIYGQPLPTNYTATAIEFDSDLVASQAFEFPAPEKVTFELLGETLPVYHGDFRAKGKILIRSGLKPGEYALKGKLKFQECSTDVCKIPQTIAFELPIRIEGMTPPAPK
jgi:AhpC/TSA family protein/cytochrome c biogenesis DsbD-like protein